MKDATLQPLVGTMFADLVQQVETAAPVGSVYTRSRDDIEYIYAKVPVGAGRLDRFVGKAGDPEAEEQATLFKTGAEQAKRRRETIAMLRRHGLAGPDRALGSALDAIAFAGLFRNGGVLVGTAAYMMMEPLVGSRLPAVTLLTGDLDLAMAHLTIAAEPPERMADILRRADPSFSGIPQLDPRKPPSRFRADNGFLIDLLTPTRSRTDSNPMVLKWLDAGAAPLQYLGWLIEEPVPTVALWGSGVSLCVPQPARFAIHKLILAQRRDPANRPKRAKDLAQASALIKALLKFDRFALLDGLQAARSKGKKGWVEPIARSLEELGMGDRIDR